MRHNEIIQNGLTVLHKNAAGVCAIRTHRHATKFTEIKSLVRARFCDFIVCFTSQKTVQSSFITWRNVQRRRRWIIVRVFNFHWYYLYNGGPTHKRMHGKRKIQKPKINKLREGLTFCTYLFFDILLHFTAVFATQLFFLLQIAQ